jgi:hypothetical protein
LKNQITIQIKTSLLLFVFLLNTMVVFSCSLGMDMKFNSNHHQENSSSLTNHHHKSESKHHENEKHNCCKDEAVKFAKTDKLTPQTSYTGVNPISYPAILPHFYYFNILESDSNIFINKLVILGHHPPIRDIRVAIQSFQI